MKIILAFFLVVIGLFITNFVINTNSVVVDNYKVIKVDGKILYEKSGKNMITGDLFLSNEKLTFITQESRAAVISSAKGRFVLTPNAVDGAASNLLPAMSNVATRSGAINSSFDLKNHFQGDYLILEEQKVTLNIESFPLSEKTFFYLQYDLKGETIAKKLKHNNGVIILNTQDIYTIDNIKMPIPQQIKMSLYYKIEKGNKTTKISDFILIAPDNNNLKSEVSVLLGNLNSKVKKAKIEEVSSFLYEFYGKPQSENVENWLKNHFEN
jgi:hypothetical protein